MSELNILIAKALGNKVVWRYSPEDKIGGYVYVRPGEDVTQCVPLCTKEEYAWELAPDFEHDVNTVVDMLPEGMELSLSKQGDFYHAGIEPVIYGLVATGWGHADTVGYADSAAHALLKYLEWKSQQEGTKSNKQEDQ